jgi:hypothetical protein
MDLMKRGIYTSLFVVGAVLLLTGCSKTPQIINTTPERTKVSELLDGSGSTPATDITLIELTDPALFSFLKTNSEYQMPSSSRNLLPGEEKKVGKLVKMTSNSKHKTSGSMQIDLGENGYILKVTDFSYNGACGPINFGLSVKSTPMVPIYSYPSIPGAVSAQSYDYIIPSTINLLQFDSVTLYCQNDKKTPSSVTMFN